MYILVKGEFFHSFKPIYIYIYINWSTKCTNTYVSCNIYNSPLAKRVVFMPIAWEIRVKCQVESYQRLKKWYLMPPCLTLSIVRYVSRIKWSNPKKRVGPSPMPWCSS